MFVCVALVEPTAKVIVGVDTHKLVHVGGAIKLLGVRDDQRVG